MVMSPDAVMNPPVVVYQKLYQAQALPREIVTDARIVVMIPLAMIPVPAQRLNVVLHSSLGRRGLDNGQIFA
jgi:hypothetical protein